ncbi:hypothetical protein Tco_1566444 [Tanacetum coccineum]
MTGNMERLDNFQEFQGGKVTFGGGKGMITGKGTIRTPTLDFENVYYVKELQHFNLFSISQICDKRNRVLFTDTDCLVLSKDFMLPDEIMVLLRVPRKNNLYTINLNNLSPKGNLACLMAKASVDESVQWHRRMGYKARTKTVPPGSIPVPTGSIKIPFGGTTISPGNVSVPTGGVSVPTGGVPVPTVEVSPMVTKRINTIHPQSLIIGDHTSAVQTRSKVNRTPTVEPRAIAQALEDPSWVDAMQEEMQQFKFQNVWVLVDL